MCGFDVILDFIGTSPFERAERALVLFAVYIPHVTTVLLLPFKYFVARIAGRWLLLALRPTIVVGLGALGN